MTLSQNQDYHGLWPSTGLIACETCVFLISGRLSHFVSTYTYTCTQFVAVDMASLLRFGRFLTPHSFPVEKDPRGPPASYTVEPGVPDRMHDVESTTIHVWSTCKLVWWHRKTFYSFSR